MKLDIHIAFPGNCREAFSFYENVLGGVDATLLAYKDTPAADSTPDHWKNKIVHGSIRVCNIDIAGADVMPEQYQAPQGFHVLLQIDSVDETNRLYAVLSDDGKITMPLQKTFWSPCYGLVVDKFSVPWELNYVATNEDLS